MGTAWIGLAGVALGALLGLLPRLWDRRDAREAREAEAARIRAEDEARRHAHQTGMLMKVARTTNEYLAAWGQVHTGLTGSAERRADTQIALDRSAEMMSTWSEALIVVGDDNYRAIVDDTMRAASPHLGRVDELDDMASAVERGLERLLGIDPTP